MIKRKSCRDTRFLILVISISALFHFGAVSAHEENSAGTFIHINENGFDPESVEIRTGGKIIFENTGQLQHWPASNLHPTHTLYPGSDIDKCGTPEEKNIFDSCRGLEPGERYEFIFGAPGRWRMHDHIDPSLKGEVIVVGEAKTAAEFEEKNKNRKNPSRLSLLENIASELRRIKALAMRIYFKIFPGALSAELAGVDMLKIAASSPDDLEYWLISAGARAVVDDLLSDSGGGFKIDCHSEAHRVGRKAFELYGGEVFKDGDAACHSGFYHGAMESFLALRGIENLAEDVREICESFPTSFGVFECLHGVGHGVVVLEDYDLPAALATCAKLSGSFSQSSCYGGAFMENIVAGQGNAAAKGHETRWVNNTDMHFPCNAVDKDFAIQEQCYLMQTSWMLYINGRSFDKLVGECQKAPAAVVETCFRSLGRDSAGDTLRDIYKIREICSKVPEEYGWRDKCYDGALNVIVDFFGDRLDREAAELCSIIGDKHKNGCYSILASRINGLFVNPEQRRKVCDTFEQDYRYLCSG